MSNSKIRVVLEGRLNAWADAQVPKVPVAFEGAPFKKPEVAFLEAFLLPNDTMHKEVSGKRKTYIGLFQINCWAPSGKGMGEVERMAEKVISLYPMLPKSGAVSIESTPSAEKPFLDESGWVIVPVTVKYRMEK